VRSSGANPLDPRLKRRSEEGREGGREASRTEVVQRVNLQTRVTTGNISAVANQELVSGAKTRDGAFAGLKGGREGGREGGRGMYKGARRQIPLGMTSIRLFFPPVPPSLPPSPPSSPGRGSSRAIRGR